MTVHLITGDETLIFDELNRLLDVLLAGDDRSLVVEQVDFPDSGGESRNEAESESLVTRAVDALVTPSLFGDRRIVVLRHVNNLTAAERAGIADALHRCIDGFDVVLTSTDKLVKPLSDAFKAAKGETISVAAHRGVRDRIAAVEVALVEAGFSFAKDVPRLIADWTGSDEARWTGILAALRSTYGEGRKLTVGDVEAFLGEQGAVAPWDLTDAIDAGDTSKALVMLHRMMSAGGSHPLQILALLSNRYAQMMRLDGRNPRSVHDVAEILGIKEYPARKVLEQYQALGSANLARAISLVAQADLDLRGGTAWEPVLVMEVLVARLARLVTGARRTPAGASRR